LRLFLKKGYRETTIEEIAAAAEISPSTFFNYFPTKEDAVLYDIYDPIALEMIVQRPKEESLSAVVRGVLQKLAEMFDRDKEMILARGRLVMEVPELRSRIWDELERTQTLFAGALAERTGQAADAFEVRVTARIFVSAMYEAVVEWMTTDGGEPLAKLAGRALDIMEQGARLTLARRPGRKQI
jgi:AcrR family transcriptional regulator